MLRKGMFLADRYEILDQIGTGGMSDVYKAKCHKLNRFVAIKILKQEFSEDKNFVSKFRIEAQSAAGLTHPNVVNVYDVGDENGIYYIVMELVEGITLKKYIEKKGRLNSKEAVSIAIQVAQGIEAAHSHHIIHRDIKPQNIIISKEGKVKVTDFGIARVATNNTINSSAMGSVHYISPEQARGGYSDERSDIYSFGITLYEMLTGTVPFDGDSTVAVAVQHIQDEIAPPSKLADKIPVSVDKIVMKCTQKKTERRYQNATELIADLKKSLVMPDVDFVKMAPVYGAVIAEEVADAENVEAAEPDAAVKTDLIDSLNDDDIDLFDDLDDLEDEDDNDQDDDIEDDDEDDEYDIEDGGNEKIDKMMKWIGIGIVGVIIIIAIFVAIKLGSALGGGDKTQTTTAAEEDSTVDESDMVSVPNLKGKTEEEATKLLHDAGLGIKVTKQPSDTVEAGQIVSQSSAAGSKVAKNTTITVKISEGKTSFNVPVVTASGTTEEAAKSTIEGAGLKAVVDYAFSDTIAQGQVISQTPKTGKVTAGDTVTITVSRGKETKNITMIDVKNMTESAARQALSAAGFSNIDSTSSKANSDTVASGSVISQNYDKGQSLAADTAIVLTISTGSATQAAQLVKVPDLTGMDIVAAEAALQASDLLITEQEEQYSDTVATGKAISWTPKTGETVNARSHVTVIFSKGPDPSKAPKTP